MSVAVAGSSGHYFYASRIVDQRLQALAVRWDKTEQRIKESELISEQVRIPAINELRYAGRQLIDALITLRNGNLTDETKEKKIYDHFVVAEQYIRNSDHDVSDATVDYIKSRLERAASIYGRVTVSERFPYFAEMRDRIATCEKLIIAARSDRTQRDHNYEEIYKNHLSRLIPLFKDYTKIEPDIIYDSLVVERKYKASKTFNLVAGLASIIGLGLAVVSWTVPWNDMKQLARDNIPFLCTNK